MGWPFETTPNERKRERKSGYEHGLKGNSVGTNWSGAEYRKGAEAGYQKYCDNRKQQEERNKSNNNSKNSSSKRSSSNNKHSSSSSHNDYSSTRYGSSSGGDYSGSYSSSSSEGFGIVGKVLFGLVLLFLIGMCGHLTDNRSSAPASVQQNSTQVNHQSKVERAISPEPPNSPAQEEALRQEAVQPPSEKIEEHARTVREFRVPMNPSIAAANDFTAEVRLPDGRTESVTIAGLTKGSDTLYVILAQDYPEGTVVTIYPKIEYSNQFVVPANPGILTSPSVSVTVQLPDGRSFQPCVQNIERGMTQLIVTTCDNYPAGTRVIVNPVYGGYRRY